MVLLQTSPMGEIVTFEARFSSLTRDV